MRRLELCYDLVINRYKTYLNIDFRNCVFQLEQVAIIIIDWIKEFEDLYDAQNFKKKIKYKITFTTFITIGICNVSIWWNKDSKYYRSCHIETSYKNFKFKKKI